MVFKIALKDPIGPDDGDQNEGNEDVANAVFKNNKTEIPQNLGTTLFPIPNFSRGKHNFRGSKSVVSRQGLGGINLSDRLESLGKAAPARTAIGELSY